MMIHIIRTSKVIHFIMMSFIIFSSACYSAAASSSNGVSLLAEHTDGDNNRPSVHNINKNRTYSSIKQALKEADSDDVIRLDAGVFSESLVIKQSVTILGPNHSISPNTGAASRLPEAILKPRGGSDAIKIISDNINLLVKGIAVDMKESEINDRYLTLDNTHQGIGLHFENNIFKHAPRVGTRGNAAWFFHEVTFELVMIDNLFYHNAPSNGIYINDDTFGNSIARISILNNVWKNNGAWAMNLHNVHGTISGNTIINDGFSQEQWKGWHTLPGDPHWPGQYGIVLANHNNNLTVSNNRFVDLYGPGIRVWNTFNGALTVTENEFINNRIAAINVNPVDWSGSLDQVLFRDNTFNGNEMAFDNPVNSYLDARHNNWSFPSGPYHYVLNVSGKGDTVSNNVLFEPWWYLPAINEPGPLRINGHESNVSEYIYVDYFLADYTHEQKTYNFQSTQYPDKSMLIYPNPVSSFGSLTIMITGRYSSDTSIFIYDIRGNMIRRLSLDDHQGETFTMDIANLPNGFYYLKVKGDDFVLTDKFVVVD